MELDRIVIAGARQHNLKNVTVEIPEKKLVAITEIHDEQEDTFLRTTGRR